MERARALFEGDDNHTGHDDSRRLGKLIAKIFNELGFQCTIEYEGELDGGPTFCKIKFITHEGKMVGFKTLQSTLSKVGWTDNHPTLNAAIVKAQSALAQFNNWPLLNRLLTTAINKVYHRQGKQVKTINVSVKKIIKRTSESYVNAVTNASHSVLDAIYGDQMRRMIKDVDEYGAIDACDYPLFFEQEVANKDPNFNFTDRRLARSFLLSGIGATPAN